MRARRQDLAALLQECLDRIDAGETAAQCLASFPEVRAELEPLLRQALRVRVAFTSSPSAAFQARAHEKLMFAAGRDVKVAYNRTPDPRFVEAASRRFLTAAGADAQEALRAVPPPRLAFWMNARQRLLDEAKVEPAPRRAQTGPTAALRFGMSAAIIVLALSLAGIGYMLTQVSGPSASDRLALLDSDQRAVEQQIRDGVAVPAPVLNALTRRALELAAENPGASQSSALILRQKEIIEQAAQVDPSLQEAPEIEIARQQLTDAQSRLAAAAAPEPSTVAEPSALTAVATNTPSAPPSPTSTPTPLEGDQIRISALTSDTTFGSIWFLLESPNLKVVIPAGSDWQLINATTGTQTLEEGFVRMSGPLSTTLLIDVRTGQINAIVGDNQVLLLRSEEGTSMGILELVDKAGPVATVLSHILETVEYQAPREAAGSASGEN